MLFGIAIALVVVVYLTEIKSLKISDTILEDTKFYYRKLTKYSSTKVTIELSLSHVGSHQTLYIYTFDDKPHIPRNCSSLVFGQLRNEDFHLPLRYLSYRLNLCEYIDNIFVCRGKTTFQDYKRGILLFHLDLSVIRNMIIQFHLRV